MALDRAGDQVELGDHTQLAFAIGHQLTIALHRRESRRQCGALGVPAHAELRRDLVGVR